MVVEADPLVFYAAPMSGSMQFRRLNGLPGSGLPNQFYSRWEAELIDMYIAKSREYRVFDASGKVLPLAALPSTEDLARALLDHLPAGWWDARDAEWLGLMNNTPKRFGHRPA